MPLAPGTRLGPYEILAPLGAGGMGEVYRARDPRLERDVAIKALPDAFALDVERLARFEREAKLLASLNHPNIAGIHGLEEVGGHRYLVLEYVEGATLAERITGRPMPVDEALGVCRQIAAALEAAHESGVVHRDLKPANVKITPAGDVKVLDFGLAKGGGAGSPSGANLSISPTLTQAATNVGVVLGTAAYMSPEQARGKVVDRRTDIWSFGCVLFECLTGGALFEGETVSDLIARILEREPDWQALPPRTPARVRELLKRCLEKDAKQRMRDMGDARIELEAALRDLQSSGRMAAAAAEEKRSARRPLAAVVARTLGFVLLGAVAGIALWSSFGPGASTGARSKALSQASHVSVVLPTDRRFTQVHISPDGSTLVGVGRAREQQGSGDPVPMLYARRLDDYDVKPLPGTEGFVGFLFAPGGRSLLTAAQVAGSPRPKLLKMPVDGSAPPITIAEWRDEWDAPTPLHSGEILIMADNGTRFFRLPATGGEPGPSVKVDVGSYRGTLIPREALPGDRTLLLNGISYGERGWFYRVALLDLRTGKVKFILDDAGNAHYQSSGHLLFTRGDVLYAAPFDLGRLAAGTPVPILSGLLTSYAALPANFEISDNGTLAYYPGGVVGSERRLAIVSATGAVTPWSEERRAFGNPFLSRDGRRLACRITNSRGIDEIWTSSLDHPALRRIVAVSDADCSEAIPSPDGVWVAYTRSGRDANDGIYLRRADGQDEPRLLVKSPTPNSNLLPTGWSSDGTALLYDEAVGGRVHVRLLPAVFAGGAPKPRALISGLVDDYGASVSPDGQLVAFGSNESGKSEVYVCVLHPDGTVGDPMQFSSGGGNQPTWGPHRRTLFYVAPPRRLMAVETGSTRLRSEAPAQVLDLEKLNISQVQPLPDGRFLGVLGSELERGDVTTVNLVLGFSDRLRDAIARARRRT